jgi:hypothetical protein
MVGKIFHGKTFTDSCITILLLFNPTSDSRELTSFSEKWQNVCPEQVFWEGLYHLWGYFCYGSYCIITVITKHKLSA